MVYSKHWFLGGCCPHSGIIPLAMVIIEDTGWSGMSCGIISNSQIFVMVILGVPFTAGIWQSKFKGASTARFVIKGSHIHSQRLFFKK
jgi:hypothetical protein